MPDQVATAGPAVMERLDELGRISERPDALLRRCFTPEHARANSLVGSWMAQAGMTVRTDAIGNIVGRYEGQEPGAPALLIGSHLDTVIDAGKYDGMLGVVGGIACVEALHRAQERLPHAVEVIGFADEEGTRFASTFLGSRAVAGTFDPSLLDRRDADGISLAEAMLEFGLDPERIPDATRQPEELAAYLELHIEQGPVLEAAERPLGVVTSIAGTTRLLVEFDGIAGHAGTVPMALRQDALAGAAEVVLAVEALCRRHPDLVGTVGRLEAFPGAINVIPGAARFTVDLRAPDDAVRKEALAALEERIQSSAQGRSLTARTEILHEAEGTPCTPWLSDQLTRAIEAEGFQPMALFSGAGHDAVAMAPITPMAMLFLRCAGGISHNPAEAISAADADAAIRTLLRAVRGFRAEG